MDKVPSPSPFRSKTSRIYQGLNNVRLIDDILHFRQDISPFLVHLTKNSGDHDAKGNLKSILKDEQLRPGSQPFCDVKYAIDLKKQKTLSERDKLHFFTAICFSETPLSEIHCLLEIDYRNVNLEPYGIVFLKEKLETKNVSPVCYINNIKGDKNSFFYKFGNLVDSDPDFAKEILPLLSVFGNKIMPRGCSQKDGNIDFRWEREWRLPAYLGPLPFDNNDVFIGLCPHDEIDEFEAEHPEYTFIDPRRNLKWYSTKLINRRQELDMKHSVV